MSDLEQFWHNQGIVVPNLIRIAISHYQFETIHPFLDGNGRIGRLLVPLYLVHWVRFFLQGVAQTAGKGRTVFRQILQLRTEVEAAVQTTGRRAAMAKTLLQHLYRNPMVTASEVEKILSVSTPTANAFIKDFTKRGILTETTGQMRGRIYVFQRYLALFLQ